MSDNSSVYAVIMAGGSGTRFWPLSRNAKPKQLSSLVGKTTMIQATVARLQPLIQPDHVLVITTATLVEETRRQLPMLKREHVIAEPVGRDTAACVCLAAMIVEQIQSSATMLLLPADHVIEPADAFQAALKVGIEQAKKGNLVTYGITPRFPATGYGYIKLGHEAANVNGIQVSHVDQFVEKPDLQTAHQYIAEEIYRWNSGIFTWRSDIVLRELKQHCSWLTDALAPLRGLWGKKEFVNALAQVYPDVKRISIDFALMEKSEHIVVVTGDFQWDDLGSWDALYAHLPESDAGVISLGDVINIECRNSLLMNTSKSVLVGIELDDLTVVATDDAILVVPKGQSQLVKQAVELLKVRKRDELL